MQRSHIVQFLGAFSLGLGLVELVAPGRLGRLVGLDGRQRLLQAYGLREIGAGLGLLSRSRSGPWLWARVAGDALDVATLAAAFGAGDDDRRKRVMLTVGAVAPIVLLDIAMAASSHQRRT